MQNREDRLAGFGRFTLAMLALVLTLMGALRHLGEFFTATVRNRPFDVFEFINSLFTLGMFAGGLLTVWLAICFMPYDQVETDPWTLRLRRSQAVRQEKTLINKESRPPKSRFLQRWYGIGSRKRTVFAGVLIVGGLIALVRGEVVESGWQVWLGALSFFIGCWAAIFNMVGRR